MQPRPAAVTVAGMHLRSTFISLAVAGAGLLAVAPVAGADSIVYIDQGNVWTMKGDGTGRVQLTDGGRWHSPTQADDGTIAAVDGTGPIVVMTKDGRQLRTIQTPAAKSGDGGTFAPRPVSLAFSPDGSKIAYSYVANSCPVASTCGTVQRSTFYTEAAGPDATPIARWGNDYGVDDPEWVTNSRVLTTGGSGSLINFDDLDDGADYSHKQWFDWGEDVSDAEISRDGKKLATTLSYGSNLSLGFFAVEGDVTTGMPPAAKYGCRMEPFGKAYADPSWSPDSSSVAYATEDGIWQLRFSRLEPNAYDYPGSLGCETDGDEHLVVPGGSQPDWGPADPATSRYPPPAGGGTPNGGGNPNGGGAGNPGGGAKGGPSGGSGLTVTVGGAARQRFAGVLKATCAVSAAGRCRGVAKVKVGRRTFTSKAATVKVKAGTRATLKLRFSATAKTAIRKALRTKRLKARVTVTSGGHTSTRTVTLTR